MSEPAAARVGLAAWVATLIALLVFLHRLGGAVAPPPVTDPGRLGPWLEVRQPAEAAIALVRLVALGLAWYLLVATVVTVAARLTGSVRLARTADFVSPGTIRRLVSGALGLTMAAATLGGPALAAGQQPTNVTGMTTTTAVTMRRLPEAGASPTPTPTGPDEAPVLAPPAEPGRRWEIRPGEHFWSVAEQVLAEAWRRPPTDGEIDPYWRALVARNRDVLRDPGNADLLFPGQVLAVPDPPPAAPPKG